MVAVEEMVLSVVVVMVGGEETFPGAKKYFQPLAFNY